MIPASRSRLDSSRSRLCQRPIPSTSQHETAHKDMLAPRQLQLLVFCSTLPDHHLDTLALYARPSGITTVVWSAVFSVAFALHLARFCSTHILEWRHYHRDHQQHFFLATRGGQHHTSQACLNNCKLQRPNIIKWQQLCLALNALQCERRLMAFCSRCFSPWLTLPCRIHSRPQVPVSINSHSPSSMKPDLALPPSQACLWIQQAGKCSSLSQAAILLICTDHHWL